MHVITANPKKLAVPPPLFLALFLFFSATVPVLSGTFFKLLYCLDSGLGTSTNRLVAQNYVQSCPSHGGRLVPLPPRAPEPRHPGFPRACTPDLYSLVAEVWWSLTKKRWRKRKLFWISCTLLLQVYRFIQLYQSVSLVRATM